MSISSAMNTAVSGLKAQSQALSVISNNLANSSTTGYKTVETQFSSLVTQMYSGTSYSGAGVTSSSRQNVSSQGTISATSSNTDLALDGNGMFVVSYGGTDGSMYFTRDGAFETDKNGYLTNNNYYLMGWPTDDQGNIIGEKSAANLQRINVTNNVSSVQPTSTATIDADLGPNTSVTGISKAASSSISSTNAADVSGLGTAAGDSFTVTTSDGTSVTYTVADTDSSGEVSLAEIAASINATSGANVKATIATDSSGKSTLTLTPTTDGASLASIANVSGTAATDLGLITSTGAVANATMSNTSTSSMEVYDTLGNAHTVTMTWSKTASNTWSVGFSSSDGTLTSSPASVELDFDTKGQLTSASADSLNLSFDWGNGSSTSQTIAVDLSSVTQTSSSTGVSQTSANTDGHATGKLLNVTIGEDGAVVASYDNSQKVTLYKVAVATFPNYNGLAAMSNGVYEASSNSGNYSLHVAGEDGSAVIDQSSLESSTVDTADEFTKMIVAQQAYSAASQVITTAKDMFDTLISAVR
ncbi:MAG: flagellar hook-basal body complex protein [Bacteroidota bacterium]